MAKSELTAMEASGVLRKIKKFSNIDTEIGLIEKTLDTLTKMQRSGLINYSIGAFNDEYGLKVMNGIISGDGMVAISATRDGTRKGSTFTISISSVFDDRLMTIDYPHKEYE